MNSKLPDNGTTIFSHMSALSAQHGAINLSQGFPDFDAPPALLEAMTRAVMDGHNQYAPMAGDPGLRDQIARQIRHYRDVRCDSENEITVVPGATEGIFCAITATVRPGDEVIVLDPCYDSYLPAIQLAGGSPVRVPLTRGRFRVDWDRVEAAVTPRSRMMIINSPHNPSGAIFSDDDMLTLQSLATVHELFVVSDEVYEHLVFDGAQHRSVLQYPGLRERSFAVFSFGKTYCVTGWKTGYVIAPPVLTTELRKIHQYVTFVAVTPVQRALAEFMQTDPGYPETLAAFYQAKRDLFCDALTASRFQWRPSEGSFFQLLDYSAIADADDLQLCEDWTCDYGVASIPISLFYQKPPEQHYLRFCFAKSDGLLLRAAEILCEI